MDSELYQQLGRMEAMLARSVTQLDALSEAIYGNGKPGINTRLDRLEQAAKRHKWTMRTLIAGAIAFLGDWLLRFTH